MIGLSVNQQTTESGHLFLQPDDDMSEFRNGEQSEKTRSILLLDVTLVPSSGLMLLPPVGLALRGGDGIPIALYE